MRIRLLSGTNARAENPRAGPSSVEADLRRGPQAGLWDDGPVGPVELRPALGAQRVVELHEPAAARALPTQLVRLPPVEERAQQPEERHACPDEEPQPEARALPPPHEPGGQPEGQEDGDGGETSAAHSGSPELV